ncbi:hypothetical protein BT63DRAFT_241127 [Microthyrium microscopicum]|uniref:Secreted protein n=1 Tax=Microthyrium microscopicum TaxID=703497 RepID=A0A6A6UG65_9PEZI|nr:hypothetical protein BT63DRAFT_241127 [Microthyrium microscopicum]
MQYLLSQGLVVAILVAARCHSFCERVQCSLHCSMISPTLFSFAILHQVCSYWPPAHHGLRLVICNPACLFSYQFTTPIVCPYYAQGFQACHFQLLGHLIYLSSGINGMTCSRPMSMSSNVHHVNPPISAPGYAIYCPLLSYPLLGPTSFCCLLFLK